jgi:hypothetical protein
MRTMSLSMTLAVVISLVFGNSIAAAGEGDIPEKGWSPFAMPSHALPTKLDTMPI